MGTCDGATLGARVGGALGVLLGVRVGSIVGAFVGSVVGGGTSTHEPNQNCVVANGSLEHENFEL